MNCVKLFLSLWLVKCVSRHICDSGIMISPKIPRTVIIPEPVHVWQTDIAQSRFSLSCRRKYSTLPPVHHKTNTHKNLTDLSVVLWEWQYLIDECSTPCSNIFSCFFYIRTQIQTKKKIGGG